jgi:hypothetical protein
MSLKTYLKVFMNAKSVCDGVQHAKKHSYKE